VRDDSEIFADFDDQKNDAALFIGWLDNQTGPIVGERGEHIVDRDMLSSK
jgi:hypothetical protein